MKTVRLKNVFTATLQDDGKVEFAHIGSGTNSLSMEQLDTVIKQLTALSMKMAGNETVIAKENGLTVIKRNGKTIAMQG